MSIEEPTEPTTETTAADTAADPTAPTEAPPADRAADGTAVPAADRTTAEIRAARQKLVLDHFHDEVRQDWDDVLATFPHPHYELIPTMTVHDGDSAVRGYYHSTRLAFPDQDHEIIALRHSDDAVIAEFWLLGTHSGPLGAIPPTGNRFRVRMTAYFIFDEHEQLICERVYFDSLTLLKQLIGGLNLKNPRNWPLAVRCLRGLLKEAGGTPDPGLLNTPKAALD